jgi:hypothetical protein
VFALAISQTLRDAGGLVLADFRNVWITVGTAVAAAMCSRAMLLAPMKPQPILSFMFAPVCA